jgi:hypothetical protein
MAKALARFTISRSGGDYILQFEVAGGDTLDLRATYDQLDLIADAIDEELDRDEDDALGVDGDRKE